MKKVILITLIISNLVSFSQSSMINGGGNINIRHVEGTSGLSIGTGITRFFFQDKTGTGLHEKSGISGKYYEIKYTYLLKKDLGVNISFNYEHVEIFKTIVDYITIPVTVDKTIRKIKEKIYFNGNGGLIIGGQYSNNKEYNKPNELFMYGINFGLNTEIYLYKQISTMLYINQIYEINKNEMGKWHPQIGLSIKYSL